MLWLKYILTYDFFDFQLKFAGPTLMIAHCSPDEIRTWIRMVLSIEQIQNVSAKNKTNIIIKRT